VPFNPPLWLPFQPPLEAHSLRFPSHLSIFTSKPKNAKNIKFNVSSPRLEPITMGHQINTKPFNQFIIHARNPNSIIIIYQNMFFINLNNKTITPKVSMHRT